MGACDMTFMQFILRLEEQAHCAPDCLAVDDYNGHRIQVHISLTQVHKYRGALLRTYWLDGARLPLLTIQERVCTK